MYLNCLPDQDTIWISLSHNKYTFCSFSMCTEYINTNIQRHTHTRKHWQAESFARGPWARGWKVEGLKGWQKAGTANNAAKWNNKKHGHNNKSTTINSNNEPNVGKDVRAGKDVGWGTGAIVTETEEEPTTETEIRMAVCLPSVPD